MTREEAMIYLPVNNDEELRDAYDDQLFEFKQFFLNRFPISKVIYPRLKKLRLVYEAYNVLGGDHQGVLSAPVDSDFKSRGSVRETIQEYQKARNKLKMQIHEVDNAADLDQYVKLLLEKTRRYAECWAMNESFDTNGISIGKEPDPMELLTAIDDFEGKGNASFEDLWKFEEENALKTEAKRLSLWLKLEQNDK